MGIVDQQVKELTEATASSFWLDERLEFTALQDNLTELPSWLLFQDRLRHSLALAKRNNTEPAFVFVELKGFHFSKDNLERNSLFKDVAYRLNRIKREIDTLARFNDTMFVLLLENIPNKSNLDLITKRIYDALSVPFETKGQEIRIEPNIYVSTHGDSSVTEESPKTVNIAGLSLTQARKSEIQV